MYYILLLLQVFNLGIVKIKPRKISQVLDNEPTIFPAPSKRDYIHEFRLKSGMYLIPNRRSKNGVSFRVQSLIVTGEKSG